MEKNYEFDVWANQNLRKGGYGIYIIASLSFSLIWLLLVFHPSLVSLPDFDFLMVMLLMFVIHLFGLFFVFAKILRWFTWVDYENDMKKTK